MLVHEGKTTRATVKRVEGSMHGNGVINPYETGVEIPWWLLIRLLHWLRSILSDERLIK